MKENKLRVFDFDDTLVSTNSVIRMTNNGVSLSMSPGEYAAYIERDGDEFDFSDFDKVKDPKRKSMMTVFKRRVEANKGRGVVVLTARAPSAKRSVSGYLRSVVGDYAMKNIEVVTLGSSDPFDKALWIRDKVLSEGVTDVYFADDSWPNCRAVGDVMNNIPAVNKLEVQKV